VRTNPQDGQQLLDLAGAVEEISAGTVAQAYADGDQLARALIEETATYLAAGVVSIINAFNPCLLVFGGGVIQGLPGLVSLINGMVRSNALQAAVEGLRIEVGTLGDKAGVIGAAALAHYEYGEPI
jgi:glucokinase